jgi:hypothetical protein
MNRAATIPADLPASPETLSLARKGVRDLLLRSPAFRAMPRAAQREIANNTVRVAAYIAEPDGIRVPAVKAPEPGASPDPYALTLDDPTVPRPRPSTAPTGEFQAMAAREGAAVAGLLLNQVDFPNFVSGLISGVFHSIVESSIDQMEAYGKLVADVAKTLNQFRDENVSVNQGRDHLVEQFPDTFFIDVDTGAEGGPAPRVRVRDGVDEDAAIRRINATLPVEGGAAPDLSEETIEERLVPAARTQLATSRQQLLATMVMMGINRIVVTDGRIAAKVIYDFQARDNFRKQVSATTFDYGDQYKVVSEADVERSSQGGEQSNSGKWNKDSGNYESSRRDASYYSKGIYKTTAEPVLKVATATQATTEAALQTKASVAGQVEVNFKSETFPLEKLADSFQIGRIQDAARPGQPVPATARPSQAAGPASGGTTQQPAPTPTRTTP